MRNAELDRAGLTVHLEMLPDWPSAPMRVFALLKGRSGKIWALIQDRSRNRIGTHPVINSIGKRNVLGDGTGLTGPKGTR